MNRACPRAEKKKKKNPKCFSPLSLRFVSEKSNSSRVERGGRLIGIPIPKILSLSLNRSIGSRDDDDADEWPRLILSRSRVPLSLSLSPIRLLSTPSLPASAVARVFYGPARASLSLLLSLYFNQPRGPVSRERSLMAVVIGARRAMSLCARVYILW